MTSSSVDRTVADGTIPKSQTLIATSPNKLKLGIFGINLAGGAGGISTMSGPMEVNNWEEQKNIAIMADRAGFEVLVPVSRWKGLGGPSGHWDRSYETWTWGAALAAATERIQIFTTCAIPLYHPVMAAKLGATLDHISGGRWGLNIVPGWFASEFKMFGMDLGDRDSRYKYAQEWVDILDRLWSEKEAFDFEGEYFKLEGAESAPKPMQTRPTIMNAGQSTEGQKFAVENADMIYIKLRNNEECRKTIESIRAQASAAGREVAIWGNLDVICKPTEQEARDFAAAWTEASDDEALGRFVEGITGSDSASMDFLRDNPETANILRLSGGGESVIGSPEQIAEALQGYSDLGMDGLALTFHEYPEAVEYFISDVHPLLVKAGLRTEPSLES